MKKVRQHRLQHYCRVVKRTKVMYDKARHNPVQALQAQLRTYTYKIIKRLIKFKLNIFIKKSINIYK